MGRKQKLIDRLKSKPRDFTFNEAESLLLALGFVKSNKGKTSGSRVLFKSDIMNIELHKPHPHKELPIYHINEILKKLEGANLI